METDYVKQSVPRNRNLSDTSIAALAVVGARSEQQHGAVVLCFTGNKRRNYA
jgi:hypothetical protein